MTKFILIPILFDFLFQGCAQAEQKKEVVKRVQPQVKVDFKLTDFLKENAELDKEVEKVFATLDDTAIVAQLVMPAVGRLGQTEATIKKYLLPPEDVWLTPKEAVKYGIADHIIDFY